MQIREESIKQYITRLPFVFPANLHVEISSKAFMSGFPFSVIKPEPEPETNKNILPIIKSYYF